MDAAYTQQQIKIWSNMSEPARHAWMLREIPNHYDNCSTCRKHWDRRGRPLSK